MAGRASISDETSTAAAAAKCARRRHDSPVTRKLRSGLDEPPTVS